MRNAALAVLIGLCTACASQTSPGTTSPTKPAATVPASSGVAPAPSSPPTPCVDAAIDRARNQGP
jgi:hypothetical protein